MKLKHVTTEIESMVGTLGICGVRQKSQFQGAAKALTYKILSVAPAPNPRPDWRFTVLLAPPGGGSEQEVFMPTLSAESLIGVMSNAFGRLFDLPKLIEQKWPGLVKSREDELTAALVIGS